jgi:hypothetical protein
MWEQKYCRSAGGNTWQTMRKNISTKHDFKAGPEEGIAAWTRIHSKKATEATMVRTCTGQFFNGRCWATFFYLSSLNVWGEV